MRIVHPYVAPVEGPVEDCPDIQLGVVDQQGSMCPGLELLTT